MKPSALVLASFVALLGLASAACGDGPDPPAPTRTPTLLASSPTTGPSATPGPTREPFVLDPAATTTASGLQYVDLEVGTGDEVVDGATISFHYTLLLLDGTELQSNVAGAPATAPLERVVPGFAEGVIGMKEGGSRRLYVPSELAYGASPPDPSIPVNADLIFEVEIVSTE